MLATYAAIVCLFWYLAIAVISTIGYVQIWRFYRSRKHSESFERIADEELPHITVIRPVKGLDPFLYECLSATFLQDYPKDKLSIRLCVSSATDSCIPTIERLLSDFLEYDAQLLIEDDDPLIKSSPNLLGPNPKIRNMSRAYREAPSDLIWIIDCNVWVSHGVARRMADRLCGLSDGQPYKFVHQLPLVIDVTPASDERRFPSFGARLDEMFLASAHAKFYTAINTVLVAPCIVGKSNMFRKSHLDILTAQRGTGAIGIDFFSFNICEDHLIGDLLWKNDIPSGQHDTLLKLGNHAILLGDLAIQPIDHMSVHDYVARRIRWLRVRKFTVTLATMVEPGTESLVCSTFGAFAASHLGTIIWPEIIDGPMWSFCLFWLLSIVIWISVDRSLYKSLHSMGSVSQTPETPPFAIKQRRPRRRLPEWLSAWISRELLALPIWIWAVFGGVTVDWRGKRFKVGTDMRVTVLGDADMNDNRRRTD